MSTDFINNIKIVCRGCLSTDDIINETLSDESLNLIFTECTNIKITEDDELPVNICTRCLHQCISWLSFKHQCEESDSILKTLAKKNYESNNEDERSVITDSNKEQRENSSNKSSHTNLSEVVQLTNELSPEPEGDSANISGDEKDDFIDDDDQLGSTEPVSPAPKLNIRKKKNSIICPVCGKLCQNEDRLAAHNRLHAGLKPEVCKICGKEFDNQRALRRHRTKHENSKPHVCTDCGKTYKYANSLRLHRKIHQNFPTYVCDFCGKSFYRAHGLQSHLLTHSTETPFSCNTCGKKFKSKTMLHHHQIRHEGIKKFVCLECDKTFTTSAELTTHSRSHSGIKPFGCTMCEKKYKTQSHLAVHMRSHTGVRPYSCDLCPQSFAHNKVLKQHRLTHTGERPYVCHICKRPFRQKGTLHVHMRTHKNAQTVKEILIPLAVMAENSDDSSVPAAITIVSTSCQLESL